ncbi:MAG TPA: molecular chaperone TorD family protein [Candidatus Limnocylindria bacterium]|nr:molecular chaperone TorD family protein [Candidatus Limnocylindria bacterium]
MSARSTRTEDALRSAADWRLLGLLLERPRPGWADEVRALARETRDAKIRQAAAAARGASEGQYLALLGPGGAASPREAAYCGMRDPAAVLADVERFYRAFAFAARTEDPPDHVAVEVAFVAYLHLKEAFALEAGDAEAAETTRAARTAFVADHLATTVRGLEDRLPPAFGAPAVRAVGELAGRVPLLPPGTTPAAGDEPLECGACVTGAKRLPT